MTERHPLPQRQQALRLDRACRRLGDPEPLRRAPDERRIAEGVCGSEQQQAPRVPGQLRQPTPEALLDPSGQRQRRGQTEPACQLRRRQAARQLQQGQRIPARLDHDPLDHSVIQPTRQDGLQEGPRITVTQRPDVDLREARQRVPRFAGGEHERDPLRQQTASDERERSSRRPVEPLRVVDQAEEGPLLGRLRHEAQDRQPDQERIRASARRCSPNATESASR